jgi:hypothetical protein
MTKSDVDGLRQCSSSADVAASFVRGVAVISSMVMAAVYGFGWITREPDVEVAAVVAFCLLCIVVGYIVGWVASWPLVALLQLTSHIGVALVEIEERTRPLEQTERAPASIMDLAPTPPPSG